MTYEPGIIEYQGFPETADPVWILGRKYSAINDLKRLRADVLSRIWLTYRKNFSPIGGTGPTSDAGWGCMLRCGQMVLAQALINRHLGRDWIWDSEEKNSTYLQILKLFQDRKDSIYSIHQIAQMGISEGKKIGEWFGPNTVAHVLKKLVLYDNWSSIRIHVAMDNIVICSDIKDLCKVPLKTDDSKLNLDDKESVLRSRHAVENIQEYKMNCDALPENITYLNSSALHRCSSLKWHPLLLFIPLRLGLFDINPIYFDALKAALAMPQSLGIIGGRPNHALYFIGSVGDELVFLDPHTTQPVVDLLDDISSDESYHCSFSGRMNLNQLDPSIAMCFYCDTEADFEKWCLQSQQVLTVDQNQALFEIFDVRPTHLSVVDEDMTSGEFDRALKLEDRKFDTSDDEFELL